MDRDFVLLTNFGQRKYFEDHPGEEGLTPKAG
jgi:hypothetical protein